MAGRRGRTSIRKMVRLQAWWALGIATLTVLITVALYFTRGSRVAFLQSILQFLYLLPIGLTAYSFGLDAGMGLGLLCTSLFLPILAQSMASGGVTAGTVSMFVAMVLYVALAYLAGSLGEARRRQERLQETLNLLGAVLDQSLSLPALLPVILSRSAELLGAERGEIFLRDERAGRLRRAARIGYPPGETAGERGESAEDTPLPEWLLERGTSFLSDDLPTDPRFYPAEEVADVPHSVAAAPLYRGPQPFGLLVLEDRPGGFDPEDLHLLEAVAEKCGIAIENARLYGELRAFSQELEERVRQRTAELSRESQQREAILQSIADGVVVADRQGRLLLFNPVAAQVFPCLREEALGKLLLELAQCPEEKYPCQEAFRSMAEFLASAGSPVRPSMPILRIVSGNRTWVALNNPVTADSGEIQGVVAILHDITQEIEAIDARTRFVSAVAHELRAPLTSIRGYSDLLLIGPKELVSEEQRRSYMETIQRNTERMSALVRDLLDLCRLESGQVRVEISPTSLRTAVAEVTALLRPQLDEKDLAPAVQLPEDLPLVLADPQRLNQILTNLVTNACRYTPPEGQITITARFLPSPRPDPRRYPAAGTPCVEVAVQDSGIGIPAEDQERIFDRFVRLEHPLVKRAGGTGLGLTIVRQLLQLQEGRIWVESAPGRGSTFYFTLPTAE